LLGFAAVNTGNNLLYLIVSLLLGFMTISGLLGWLNIRGLECHLALSDEIYCNIPTLVTLTIANRKHYIDSYLLHIQAAGGERLLTSVLKGATGSSSFIQTFHQRGRLSFETATVTSPFPVNFFVRGMIVPVESDIVIFPSPAVSGTSPFKAETSAYGELLGAERGFDGEMRTIGDYTGVEPLKQIHWRLSARQEWFKIKELATTAHTPVILDLTAENNLSLEEKLSWATSLINKACRENKEVGLRISKEKIIHPDKGRRHRLRLLRELALYA
jgi:uncharacterized protein (DUF58 family)